MKVAMYLLFWEDGGGRRLSPAVPTHHTPREEEDTMTTALENAIEKSIDIHAPVNAVYDQWTHFEDFPKFMEGVQEVRRLDENRLHWRGSLEGQPREWD